MFYVFLSGGFAGSGGCFGLSEDTVSCDRGPCPSWGPWGAVSDCSVTCGFGSTIRTRVCQNGEPNDCPGDDTLLEGCNPRVNIEYTVVEIDWLKLFD